MPDKEVYYCSGSSCCSDQLDHISFMQTPTTSGWNDSESEYTPLLTFNDGITTPDTTRRRHQPQQNLPQCYSSILSPLTACDMLVQAECECNEDLKEQLLRFISKNIREVKDTPNWYALIQHYPVLVTDIGARVSMPDSSHARSADPVPDDLVTGSETLFPPQTAGLGRPPHSLLTRDATMFISLCRKLQQKVSDIV